MSEPGERIPQWVPVETPYPLPHGSRYRDVAAIALLPHAEQMGALLNLNSQMAEENAANINVIDNLTGDINELKIDPVTGLESYPRFVLIADEVIERAEVEHEEGSFEHLPVLYYADADGLKRANGDTRHGGRLLGNRLLRAMADEIKRLGRPMDKSYRMGGDEIGRLGIGYDPSEHPEEDLDEAENRMAAIFERKLNDGLASAAHGFPKDLYLGASVSVVVYRPGEGREAFVLRADARMAENKERRKQNLHAALRARGLRFSPLDDRTIEPIPANELNTPSDET